MAAQLATVELTFYISIWARQYARALDTLGVHPPPGMTSLSSALNPLDPVPERWLAGAVVELSSSEVARAAARRLVVDARACPSARL